MRTPINTLVIGAARSGTTALTGALSRHPDVFFTEPKEVHFFAHAKQEPDYKGPGDQIMVNRAVVHDPEAFNRLFDNSGHALVRGEGSVSTLYYPDRSIPAIDQYADPDVRLLAIVRQPARRSYSSYLFLRGLGHEPLDRFEEGLEAEEERRELGYHHMWHYRGVSRYSQQLPQFAERYGDRLHIVVHEDYLGNPDVELARICRHLDIDPAHISKSQANTNSGGVPRSRLLTNVHQRLVAHQVAHNTVRAILPQRARTALRAASLRKPMPDRKTIAALNVDFRADIQAVEQLLGRKIPAWEVE